MNEPTLSSISDWSDAMDASDPTSDVPKSLSSFWFDAIRRDPNPNQPGRVWKLLQPRHLSRLRGPFHETAFQHLALFSPQCFLYAMKMRDPQYGLRPSLFLEQDACGADLSHYLLISSLFNRHALRLFTPDTLDFQHVAPKTKAEAHAWHDKILTLMSRHPNLHELQAFPFLGFSLSLKQSYPNLSSETSELLEAHHFSTDLPFSLICANPSRVWTLLTTRGHDGFSIRLPQLRNWFHEVLASHSFSDEDRALLSVLLLETSTAELSKRAEMAHMVRELLVDMDSPHLAFVLDFVQKQPVSHAPLNPLHLETLQWIERHALQQGMTQSTSKRSAL
jgi:hypothetical protein